MPDGEKIKFVDDRLTLPEVATACDVNEKTVRRWIQSGELKAGRDLKSRYRIAQTDLEAFVKRKTES